MTAPIRHRTRQSRTQRSVRSVRSAVSLLTSAFLGSSALPKRSRSRFVEPLEDRRLLSVTTAYVAPATDFTDPTNPGNPQKGDTVTWNGGGQFTTPVSGLTFGTDAFTSIAAAVANVSSGGTVDVAPGTYDEHSISLNQPITLNGSNFGVDPNTDTRGGEAIIDAQSLGGALTVNADNVTVDGFTIQGGQTITDSGIDMANTTSGVQILNNIITDNQIGIYADSNGPSKIQNNLITANNLSGPAGGVGIYSDATNGLTIDSNVFTDQTTNSAMIFTASAANVHQKLTVTNNVVNNNAPGNSAIYVVAVDGGEFANNDITTQNTGSALHFAGDDTNISVHNNNIDTVTNGVALTDDGFGFGGNSNITVNDNSITNASSAGLSIGLGGYTGTLDASKNWWGDISGPTIASNVGGAGQTIVDPGSQVTYAPWLIYGTDADAAAPGFQLPTTVPVMSQGDVSPALNDFTLLQNAIGAAAAGQTIDLSGAFDWTKTNSLAAYEASNATADAGHDIRGVALPDGVNNLTITSSAKNTTISGVGDSTDVTTVYNTFLFSAVDGAGATGNNNLTISNLNISNFMSAVALGWNNGGMFNGTLVKDNTITVAADNNNSLSDVQGIAVYFWNGQNQTMTGNTIDFMGNGTRTVGTGARSYGFQDGTTGGTGYNGLSIDHNTFQLLPTAVGGSEVVTGIWDNGHNDDNASHISIADNQFLGIPTQRQFDIGLQLSSQTSNMAIEGNTFTDVKYVYWVGAHNGDANGDQFTFTNNVLTRVGDATGVFLQNVDAVTPATITINWNTNNTIDGFSGIRGLNELSVQATGETRTAGGATDLNAVNGVGSMPVDFVNTNWGAPQRFTNPLTTPDGTPGPIAYGFNAFTTVQAGVNAVDAAGTVNLLPGTYAENVTINKNLTLAGPAGSPPTAIIQPAAGDGITIGSPATDVTLANLEVTGAANGINASNLTTLNLSGVTLTGNTTAGGTIANVATVKNTITDGSSETVTGNSYQQGSNDPVNYSGVTNLDFANSSGQPVTLTVNLSNGASLPTGGLAFAGGGSDQLDVTGGTFTTAVSTLTGPGAGSLALTGSAGTGSGTITYSGLAPVDTTGSTINNLVFNLAAGTTDAVLEAGPTAGTMELAFTNHSSENQIFADPSGSLTINTSGGNSVVQIAAPDSGFAPVSITLAGQSGDTFQLTASAALAGASSLTLTTATLDLNGFVDTVGGLNGDGTITDSVNTPVYLAVVGGGGTFSGAIQDGSGTVSLVVAGSTLTLSGDNSTYSGGTTIEAGTIVVDQPQALGMGTVTLADSHTGINNVALLAAFAGTNTLANDIVVANQGTGTATIGTTAIVAVSPPASGTATIFSGTLTLNRATTLQGVNGDRTTYTGSVSGDVGTLTIDGGQRTTLNGADTFVGNVQVTGSGTVLQETNATAIPSTSSVDVGAGTVFQLASFDATIDALTGSGTVKADNFIGNRTLTIGANGGSGTFSGLIEDGAHSGVSTATLKLVKNGSGTETLTGLGDSYSGGTDVKGGTLLVDTTLSLLAGAVGSGGATVETGATLGGTGSIAGKVNVNNGGTVSPGDPTSDAAILATGPLTLAGTYAAQVNGATTAGSDYDQLAVTGASTLTGGSVNVTLGYVPAAGDTITLISGTGAVTGPVSINGVTINEGDDAFLTHSGLTYAFKVSYAGDALTLTFDQTPTVITPANSTINVSVSGGNTIVTVNGNTMLDEPTTNVSQLTIDGTAGNNTLTVDYTNGDPSPGGIKFNGGGNGTLVVTGYTATTVTDTYTGPGSGSVQVDGDGLIAYTGLSPVTNSGTATNMIFNLPAGTVGASLADVAGSGQLSSTNAAFETTTFTDPTGSLTVNAGVGTDTMTVAANFTTDFAAALNLNGQSGNTDTFNLLSSSAGQTTTINGQGDTSTVVIGNTAANVGTGGSLAKIAGPLTVQNAGGSTALTVDDSGDTTAQTVAVTGSQVSGFTGVATITYATNTVGLTVDGGSGSDTFNVTPSAATTISVNGGLPTPPATPGDTLSVDTTGLTTPTLNDSLTANGYQGSWTFGNAMPVDFSGIETLANVPNLSITKTDNSTTPGFAVPGTSLTYTVVVGNSGPGDVTASVKDILPADFTADTYTATATGGATGFTPSGSGSINDSVTLPAGSTITYVVTGTISASATGTLSNTAVVMTTSPIVQTSSATDSDTLTPTADLKITKTDNSPTPGQVQPSQALTYTIVVTNNGPSDVTAASVIDTFPVAFTVSTVTASATGGASGFTGGSGNINDTVNMPVGSTITYVVTGTVSPTASGTLSNTATVTAPAGVVDTNPANNSSTDSDVVSKTTDLSITKTDNSATPGSVVPGTTLTYTIVVTNSGANAATGAKVSDTFPADFTAASYTATPTGGATGFTASGSGNISDTVNLPAGSSITYVVTGTVASSATGTLSNTATVTPPANIIDTNAANNSATDTDTLTPQADITITKTDNSATPGSAVPGTSLTYTITVGNSGPSVATATKIADALPAEFTGASFTSVASGGATGNTASGTGNISDTLALPSGSSVVYTVTGTINPSATGTLTNTATVTPGAGVTDTNASTSASDSLTLTPQANIIITKTDNSATPGSAVPGTALTYTITVSNSGPSVATATKISDVLPINFTGASFTSVGSGGATGNTASGTGNLNDTLTLPSGGSVVYTVHGTIDAAATGTLTNTATVTPGAGITDTNATTSASDTLTLTPRADITITKTDNSATPGSAVPGTGLTYTVTVSNSGPSVATATKIADVLPASFTGASFTSVASGGATGNTASGTGNLSDTLTLPSGGSVVYTITGTIDSAATGTLANTATVTPGAGVTDTNASTSATDTLTLKPQADITITKTDNSATPGSAVPGTALTYTVTVSNSGPSVATATGVSDVLPAGFTGASFTSVASGGATGNTASGTGNISDTLTLPSGGSVVYTVTGTIDPSAIGTLSNTATVTPGVGVTDTNAVTSATDSLTLTPQVDLSITKTDGSTTAVPGASDTYTIVVSNAGPSGVVGATVADTLPAALVGASFTATATGGASGFTAHGSGNISDTVNLPAGSSITYVLTGTIKSSATGTLSNTATVAAPAGVTDTNLANNSATDTDTLTPQADLKITKTDNSATPGSVVTGHILVYTIVVTNAGPSDVTAAIVSDTLPADLSGATFTATASGGATGFSAHGSGNLSDTVNLPAGSSITYIVSGTVSPAATGNLSNTATVSAPAGVTDTNTANNTATDTARISAQSGVTVTKSDSAGGNSATSSTGSIVAGRAMTYVVVVSNSGPSDVTGASIADTFPAAFTDIQVTDSEVGGAKIISFPPTAANVLEHNLDLPAGSSITFVVTGTVSASATGNLSNTANVTLPAGVTNTGILSATDTDTITTQGGVTVVKSDDKGGTSGSLQSAGHIGSISAGGELTYTIVVSNFGPSDLTGATISDAFPSGFTAASFTATASGGASGFTASGSGNISDTVNLPVGSSITYVVTGTVSSSATGSLSNTASVKLPAGATNNGNLSATDTDTIASPPPQPFGYLAGVPGDSTAQTFVHNLYRELMGREPDASGQSYWVSQVQQNDTAAGRQAVIASFMNSQEYKEHYVTTLYEVFLGRAPDAAGLQFWAAAMGSPGTAGGHSGSADEKYILSAIVGSGEFYANAGGTNQAFAEALYKDLLGRTGDTAGITFWSDLANTLPRDAVVRLFLSTPEASHLLLDSFYPAAGGTAANPLPVPGSTVAAGSDDLAIVTGDGWENLYLQGPYGSSPEANDAFFAELAGGASWDDVQLGILTTDQFYTNPNRPVTK